MKALGQEAMMGGAHLQGWSANLAAFALAFVVTFAAAALGSYASVNSVAFYGSLEQPGWAPSPAVFGPVWTLLYSLMAVAAYLVVREVGWRAALAPLLVFLLQLALNAAWTWLFFVWHLGGLALLEIIVLAIVIVANIVMFWHVRSVAGALLLPYLFWVCFATALTWSVWRLNPGVL